MKPAVVKFMVMSRTQPDGSKIYTAFVLQESFGIWPIGSKPEAVDSNDADAAVDGLKTSVRAAIGRDVRFREA